MSNFKPIFPDEFRNYIEYKKYIDKKNDICLSELEELSRRKKLAYKAISYNIKK
jgi:hypothetical protein